MRLTELLIDGGFDFGSINQEITQSVQANAGATPDKPAVTPDLVYRGGASVTPDLVYRGGASVQNLDESEKRKAAGLGGRTDSANTATE